MERAGVRLGTVSGIAVRVDASVALVFALIVAHLGAGFLPGQHPEWTLALTWCVALAAAVLFFASVLAHELAHAFVGRAQGIPVRGVTLFVFGGVAHLEEEPRDATGELLMAAVGPLTSLAIGVAATAAGIAWGGARGALGSDGMLAQLGPGGTLLLWLGPVNVALALFNMLPGFPLDGGRVLRAIVWGATKDFVKATRWASWAGQGFAMLLIGLGIANLITGAPGQGLWLILIGWFLNSAA